MIADKTICITGGTGFIGAILVGALVENNKVVVLDNFSRNALASYHYADHPNLTIIKGDVLDVPTVEMAVKDAEYIIHCAGIAGINNVCKKPTNTLRVNFQGSMHVLDAAMATGKCERVVCFSTSEVFGSMAFTSTETDHSVIGASGQARWTYAVSKLAEEHLALSYFQEFGLPTTVVRPFNIYGPGQVGEGALKALRCLENPAAIGESFNIGNARSVQTIYGLANTVIRILESNSKIRFSPAPSVDIELRIPCVNKAREILGFEAKVELEQGILNTAEHYREIVLPYVA